MVDRIAEYYEENNYPSVDKLYKIMKKDGLVIKLADVKIFYAEQEAEQLTKITFNKKMNHIVAYYPYQFVNLDIFVLSKYESANKGYQYLLCQIDIFSRHVCCVAMKNKDVETVLKAYEKIIEDEGVKPTNMITDSDTSFLSFKFQEYIKKLGINYNNVAVGDHHALGIIDRFALTLKRILTKARIASKSANWIGIIEKVIKNYNKSVHKALIDISPDQALEDEHMQFVQHINVLKAKHNDVTTDLVVGDKVRILDKKGFGKGSESRWSSEVYTVENARGNNVYLENGMKKTREMVLKVPAGTVSSTVNIDKEFKKKRRMKKLIKQSGVDEVNVIAADRVKRKPKKYDD